MALTFRRAREGDLDRLVEIHATAFPDPRGYDARVTNFVASPWGALDDLRVAEEDGVLVAHAFLFPMTMGFGGARVKVGGVATVGVAPEARGRGVATALLAHLHDESHARGDAAQVLYAFRHGFYARLGYAAASPSRHVRFHPRAVPEAWRAAAREVRAASGPKDREAIEACFARAIDRGTGLVARGARLWDRRFADERARWLVATTGRGYVRWSLRQKEAHAKTTMRVHEIFADDDDARRALWGALAWLGDQAAEVAMDVADDDPFPRALADPDRGRFGDAEIEHLLGDVVVGPMVRVGDVARAVAARGYAVDGDLDLAVDGEPPLCVSVDGGRARVSPSSGDADPLRVSRAALGAILFGGLRAKDAASLGWASGFAETIAQADALLATPPFFSPDPF